MAEQYGIDLDVDSNAAQVFAQAGNAAAKLENSLEDVGDEAKLSLGDVGKAALRAGGSLRNMGTAGVAGLGMVFDATTALNSAMEIGRKAMELWRMTVGESITKALEFRRAGDDTVEFFKDFQRETDLARARLGDALLPVFRGFIEATGTATGKMSDFFAANQKVIGSKLIEWISGVGEALINGVARTVDLVAKGWHGWLMIIDGVSAAVNTWYAGISTAIGKVLEGVSALAGIAGFDGLQEKIAGAAETMNGLSAEFERSADANIDAIHDTTSELDALEKKIAGIKGVAIDALEKGVVTAEKRVAEATVGTTRTIKEQTDALESWAARIDAFIAKRQQAREEELAREETAARTADAIMSGGDGGVGKVTGAALGQLGDIGGAIMGGLSGGAAGVASSLIGSVVQQSESLQRSLGKVTEMFGDLVAALEPMFVAVEPLVGILGQLVGAFSEALTPVFKLFGDVVTGTALVVLDIAQALSRVWNSIVDALASVFDVLGDVKVFGKRVFGFAHEWAESIRGGMVPMAEFDKLRDSLTRGADAMIEGSEAIEEATREIASSLTNVPSGIKVALRRFQATDVGQVGMLDPTSGSRDEAAPWKEAMGPLVATTENTGASAMNAAEQTQLLTDIKGTFDESGDLIETLRGIRDLTRPNQVGTVNVTAPTPSMADILAAAIAESNRTGSTSDGILAPPANAATETASQAAGYSGWQDAFARAGVGI